jgi:acyl-CoA thioesterase FadM
MQGGMLAAAVDNTIGPLSALVAPVNVTRKLEMTYSQPVTLEMGHILVKARLVRRRGRKLDFEAVVRSPEGVRLARAKALHWIVEGA